MSVFFWGAGFYFYKENNAVDTELVEGWKALSNTPLRKNINWLKRAKKWQDAGVTLIKQGNVVRLKHGTREIGRIKNGKLLATDHPVNHGNYNFFSGGATPPVYVSSQ